MKGLWGRHGVSGGGVYSGLIDAALQLWNDIDTCMSNGDRLMNVLYAFAGGASASLLRDLAYVLILAIFPGAAIPAAIISTFIAYYLDNATEDGFKIPFTDYTLPDAGIHFIDESRKAVQQPGCGLPETFSTGIIEGGPYLIGMGLQKVYA